MAVTNFEPKSVYNLTTLAPSVLGATFSLMRVEATLTAKAAGIYRDIQTKHVELSVFIDGLPENASDCTYVLFENGDGTTILLAQEWLDLTNCSLVSSVNIRTEVFGATNADLVIIRNAIAELGYANIKQTTF